MSFMTGKERPVGSEALDVVKLKCPKCEVNLHFKMSTIAMGLTLFSVIAFFAINDVNGKLYYLGLFLVLIFFQGIFGSWFKQINS